MGRHSYFLCVPQFVFRWLLQGLPWKNTLLRQQEEDFFTGNQAPSGAALRDHSEKQGRFFHRQPSPFRGRLARSFGKTTIFAARNEDDLWLETYDVVLVLQKLGYGNIPVAFLFFLWHIVWLHQYGLFFSWSFYCVIWIIKEIFVPLYMRTWINNSSKTVNLSSF